MSFTHGNYGSEKKTSTKPFVTATAPIFIVGTAAIHMADTTNINKVQLITNATQAAKYFGGVLQIAGDNPYSINELFDQCFSYHNVAPIVAVNVLDPKVHKQSVTESAVIVKNKEVELQNNGVLTETITVKKAGEEVEAIFGTYFKPNGKTVVTLDDNTITSVDITYDYLDVGLVTKEDIIGSIDPATLKKEGLQLIHEVFPTYSMIPGVIIAPGYSHEPEVKTVLQSVADKINNKYGSMSIVDIPTSVEFGDVIAYKKEKNIVSEHLIAPYGKLKDGTKIFHHSTALAALMMAIDASNDNVPYESPSNKNLKVQSLVVDDATPGEYKELLLDEDTGNVLNAEGISTAIRRSNGFVHWGNRTTIYQTGGSTDPKDMWIPSKRMFKFIMNTLMLNTASDIDDPMTYKKARNVEKNINIYLASLVVEGKLYGARVEFTEEENSVGDILNGKFTWHLYLGTVTPGETMHFILEYDAEYSKVIFA